MKSKLTLVLALFCVVPLVAQDQTGDLDTSAMDKSVRIQDDLYQHINGTWLKTTEIPSDKSNYGSFIKLADLSQKRIRSLIENVSKTEHEKGTDQQKVGDFYSSFMDEDRVNEKGIDPLRDELRKVSQLGSKKEIWNYIGQLGKMGVSSPVGFFVSQDAKNSSQYICQIIQSGTTLPDRNYYLSQDENSAEARSALRDYVRKLFDLASIENSDLAAEQVLDLETKLAKISWERVQLRDAEKRYNKHTFEELQELTPDLDWATFFEASEVERPAEVNVNTPSFFEGLEKILADTPEETLVHYLQYKLIDAYAPYLSNDFADANFALYGKQLGGIPEQKPRWKRAVEATAGGGAGDFGVLGEVVGRLYVAKYFKPDAKARMEQLVDNLLLAFGDSIDDLAWMSSDTKVKAKEKLSKIGTKIGYPNKWRDYSKLDIDAEDLFGNIQRSNYVEYRRNIDKLGKPIDREEWGMTPQTVNAYYNPTKNEIVFPAAILQSPFFSMKALDALNYGGIGAVIGHEISHAFDDQGSRYDGDGNLNNWWTESDQKAFRELTSRLVAQYREYEPLPGKNVNGELTLGENIADLSGLAIAYKAYAISRKGKEPEMALGWNGDQLFFVGWSRVWQRKYRDAEMVKRLLTDPHSPSRYRANGPVMNIEAFYTAFGVKDGDALYKPEDERIKIW